MDNPAQYSNLPLELKMEITKHIFEHHDFAFIKDFARVNVDNKNVVKNYFIVNADTIIKQALLSAEPFKRIRFLYNLKLFDSDMSKKIGEYIADSDFKSDKPSHGLLIDDDELIHKAVDLRNFTIAKIVLERPDITNLLLHESLNSLAGWTPIEPSEKEMQDISEFIGLIYNHPQFFLTIPFYLTLAIKIRRPFNLVKSLAEHEKKYINQVKSVLDDRDGHPRITIKQTLLDYVYGLPEAWFKHACATKIEYIELLRSHGAQTYEELENNGA